MFKLGRNIIDLTGQMFGSWEVLEYDKSSYGASSRWKCQCINCKKIKSLASGDLRSGKTSTCSCSRRLDLTGQIFGNWEVIGFDNTKCKRIVKCTKCGGVTEISTNSVIYENIRCVVCNYIDTKIIDKDKHHRTYSFEDLTGQIFGNWEVMGRSSTSTANRIVKCTKCGGVKEADLHRISKKPDTIFCDSCGVRNTAWGGNCAEYISEYRTWSSMKQRCYNPTDISYHNYGARDITVCDEWIDDFNTFLNDMGPKPSKEYSIDRIDVNDNYCKLNCKWSDRTTQGNNRRNNAYETINDTTLTRVQWYRLTNQQRTSVIYRMEMNGMNFEDALFKTSRLLQIVKRVDINNPHS